MRNLQHSTINCKGQLIDLSQPKVMGILNITPNSFYDGGKFKDESEIINQVEKMMQEGATFIDVGDIQVNQMLLLFQKKKKLVD